MISARYEFLMSHVKDYISCMHDFTLLCLFPSLLFSFVAGAYAVHTSFNKLLLQKEELEQKHVHLLQVVESEKTAKWQYTQQCEELASEIRKLRAEVKHKIIMCNILHAKMRTAYI